MKAGLRRAQAAAASWACIGAWLLLSYATEVQGQNNAPAWLKEAQGKAENDWDRQLQYHDAAPLALTVIAPPGEKLETDIAVEPIPIQAFAVPSVEWDSLELYTAGSIRIEQLRDESDQALALAELNDRPERGFTPELEDLTARVHDLGGRSDRQKRRFFADLKVRGEGPGYLFVQLKGRIKVDDPMRETDSVPVVNTDIVYAYTARGRTVFAELRSALPPSANPAHFSVSLPETNQGEPLYSTGFEDMSDHCYAAVSSSSAGGLPEGQGLAVFIDDNGNEHPIVDATLRVFDPLTGQQTGADSLTGPDGRFSIPPSDLTAGVTLIALYTEGPRIRMTGVSETGRPPPRVHCLRFKAHATGDLKLTALAEGSPGAAEPHLAFSPYTALGQIAERASSAMSNSPPLAQANAEFPQDGDYSSTFEGLLRIALTDAYDWDNVQHEYGHFVQHAVKQSGKPPIADSPGGEHDFGENLCAGDKGEGVRLAWSEGWANLFAISLQNHAPTSDGPDAGDTRYQDHRPASDEYDVDFDLAEILPMPDTASWHGEGNETAIQRVLWDLFDGSSGWKPSSLPAQRSKELWLLMAEGSVNFSEFYAHYLDSGDDELQLAVLLAPSLTEHRIAPKPIEPEAYQAGSPPGNFKWQPNLRCADASSQADVFELLLRHEDDAATTRSGPFPFDGNNMDYDSASPPASEIESVFDKAGDVFWRVASTDSTSPSTGPYYGAALMAKAPDTNGGCPWWWCWLIPLLLFLLGLVLALRGRVALGLILILAALVLAGWLAWNR